MGVKEFLKWLFWNAAWDIPFEIFREGELSWTAGIINLSSWAVLATVVGVGLYVILRRIGDWMASCVTLTLRDALLSVIAMIHRQRRPDERDVLKMMRGVYEHVLAEKKKTDLSPEERSRSLQRLWRVGIWRRKLIELGLHPTETDNLLEWQIYFECMIPTVEEYGIQRAIEETRRMYDR